MDAFVSPGTWILHLMTSSSAQLAASNSKTACDRLPLSCCASDHKASHTYPPLPHAVGEWEACGDAFYSREQLYPLNWQDSVHLEEMRYAVGCVSRHNLCTHPCLSTPFSLHPCTPHPLVSTPLHRIACAPHSGPLAMIRDDRQLVTVRSVGGDMRPVLRTYNAAGVLLGTSVWEGYGVWVVCMWCVSVCVGYTCATSWDYVWDDAW